MRSMSRWLVTTAALAALALSGSQTAAAGEASVPSQPAAASETAVASQPAAADQPAATARRACGFVGGETYRHCSTWTRVLIDAQNIWGKTYRNICVGPGDTHLGYLDYWVISYAWYIGKTC